MKKKLLVADDSLTIQKVIRLALKDDGYDIHAVSDGAEAIQHLSLIRPDVVLIDIDLPGGSAFDVKKSANEDLDHKKIPFILMSSAFEKVDEAKAALLGFEGRLTKPFDPTNLRSTLSAVFENKKTPPPPPSFEQSANTLEQDTNDEFADNSDDDKTVSLKLDDPLWSINNVGPESEQNDIKQLTESTVKMSGGFDDLGGWNIQENAKSNIPPLPVLFPENEQNDIPSLSSDSDWDKPMPPPPPFGRGSNEDITMTSIDVANDITDNDTTQFQTSKINTNDLEPLIEKLVKERVQKELERLTRQSLPDITEKVVRQEIRKLLENMV